MTKKQYAWLIVGLIIFFGLLFSFSLKAQELFKPGGRLEAGQEVKDLYGSVWRVNLPIAVAVTPPSTALKDSRGRAYYTYLRAGEAPSIGGGEVYAINVQEVGVLPTNTPERNSKVIDSLINSFPLGATHSVYIPTGNYYFLKTIILDAKPIHLFGDNGTIFSPYSTKLYFPDGITGIHVKRSAANYQEAIIENICLIAQGKSIEWASGINSNARITIRGCTAKGFSHNGFDLWANLEGEGTDASGSYIEKCHALENGHDGFFAGRTDANAITFIGNDARDNGRYGFNDDSFLGNNFYSCMAHYNKAGDFYVRDKWNARSLFSGCYSEGGNVPSGLSKLSTIVGGIWGTGYTQN